MNTHPSLFAPSPRRKRGLVLTLTASLLFHGSLIGVAALWTTRPEPRGPIVTELGDPPQGFVVDGPALPPEPVPVEQEMAQPDMKVEERVDVATPPVEPEADSMLLSTPRPPSAPRTAARPVSTLTTARTVRTPGGLSSAGSPAAGAGVGNAGSGVLWNKPKPVYPTALRLARVQGSGVVRVTTDGTGRVVNAVIVQSTGNTALDDNTCRSARSLWSGPPNATLSVPVTYRLQ